MKRKKKIDLIDDKGIIFGKINIIDLAIILVAILVLVSIIKIGMREKVDLEYVEIPSLEREHIGVGENKIVIVERTYINGDNKNMSELILSKKGLVS